MLSTRSSSSHAHDGEQVQPCGSFSHVECAVAQSCNSIKLYIHPLLGITGFETGYGVTIKRELCSRRWRCSYEQFFSTWSGRYQCDQGNCKCCPFHIL